MNDRPPTNPNAALIAGLQAKLEAALAAAVPDRRARYVLLDFPNHMNIGDSAIYAGEDILVRKHFGRPPQFVTETGDAALARVRDARKPDVILLHGGGNFGDIWKRHHLFREAVIAARRDVPIVQLPQTLHFRDPDKLRQTAAIINAHPDFTLMVRDRTSEAIANAHFRCKVRLVPDAAFMIGATPAAAADLATLALFREDHEAADRGRIPSETFPQPVAVVDWPQERRGQFDHLRSRALPRRVLRRLGLAERGWTPDEYRALARARVDTGLALLARGRTVVTDRLHAHILSLLLGRPHVVLDNNYGKVSSFITAWTEGGRFATAATLEEAADRALDFDRVGERA